VQSRGALPFFTRFYVALPIPAARSACPPRRANPFGACPPDDDDLAFISRHEVLRSTFQYQISFSDGFSSSHERLIAIVLCDDSKL
jgi:hypothetical protein